LPSTFQLLKVCSNPAITIGAIPIAVSVIASLPAAKVTSLHMQGDTLSQANGDEGPRFRIQVETASTVTILSQSIQIHQSGHHNQAI
jgi:hypothetical protein